MPRILFVLPTTTGRSAAINANLIAAAELSTALTANGAHVDILTPSGICTVDQLFASASRDRDVRARNRALIAALPQTARSLIADANAWRRGRVMRGMAAHVVGGAYDLVLQLHRRFQDVGRLIASSLEAPFVLRVDALEVQEEALWGLRRPGWGRYVEEWGELRVLRQADLLVPVSNVLDNQLSAVGIPGNVRMVLPNGVDVTTFSPGEADPALRKQWDLDGRFVVGWIGGFRPFHGLELVRDLAQQLREAIPGGVICLLGSGPMRESLIEETRGLHDVVRYLPAVPHQDVPRWLRTFDVCLLLAQPGGFHYSPLKLYEYLGCGRPVVAARIGEINQILEHQRDALLVRPGDVRAVVEALRALADSPALRQHLSMGARRTAEQHGSWDSRARDLLDALDRRGLLRLQRSV